MKRFLLLAAAAIVACAVIVSSCRKEAVRVTGVTLDQSALTLTEGDTGTLKATVKPDNAENKAVTWKSDKTDIAGVDGTGKVTAKKAGSATITVISVDGGKTATCSVTVKAKSTQPPSAVVITGGSTTQNVGADAEALAEKISFTTTGPWSSTITEEPVTRVAADESATRAAPGWVSIDPKSGDKAGDYSIAISLLPNKTEAARSAKITITSGQASEYIYVTQAGKTKTEDPPVAVTRVTVSPSSLSLTEGETGTLTATVAPANAANKNVTWDSSNKTTATVSNDGTVTALKAGTTTITVTTEDGAKTASATVTVSAATTPPPPPPPFVAVTDITLTSARIVLTYAALNLTATVAPANTTNKTIVWSTANAGATITNNAFMAFSPGTYTVTATIVNGKSATTNYTQNFTITVTNAILPITKATIDGVIAPKAGETPKADINTASNEFTVALAWDGNPATFGYDTVYTATITLKATACYEFTVGTPPTVTLNGERIAVTPVIDTTEEISFKVAFPKTRSAKEIGFGGEGEEDRW